MSRRLPALLLAVLLAACGGGGQRTAPATVPTSTSAVSSSTPRGSGAGPPSLPVPTGPCGSSSAPPRTYQHVIWIWMENHTWSQVLGDRRRAPYESSLAQQCGTATHYASVGSPSLPNYIGATSGSTHGIGDDDGPDAHRITSDNVFGQVRNAGGTERSYEEAMTSPCQLSSAGRYAVKHNPAAYYVGASDRTACQADDVPFSALTADAASNRLPTFSFITPDLCHDTHDCSVAAGDAWLAEELPALLGSAVYRSGGTAVFVNWDEYTPMPNLVIAPSVRPGTVVSSPVGHYALLRTTEELLGLTTFLGSAASAPSMRAAFGI